MGRKSLQQLMCVIWIICKSNLTGILGLLCKLSSLISIIYNQALRIWRTRLPTTQSLICTPLQIVNVCSSDFGVHLQVWGKKMVGTNFSSRRRKHQSQRHLKSGAPKQAESSAEISSSFALRRNQNGHPELLFPIHPNKQLCPGICKSLKVYLPKPPT